MIARHIQTALLNAAGEFPIVSVTGPRQSGKTTLVRSSFPDYSYVSLEDPDQRRYALGDPRGFLSHYRDRTIFDEVQRVPELFSYIQSARSAPHFIQPDLPDTSPSRRVYISGPSRPENANYVSKKHDNLRSPG